MKQADLIISGATILSMDAELAIHQDHDLIVTDGKISAIEPQESISGRRIRPLKHSIAS